ncbi:zeta toxin family protein, partial [Listeria monocytogenes]|nr:zeta toxin family protein [Listeria monocytogenes]
MVNDISLIYAKQNKKRLITSVIDGKQVETDKTAIFMAGSPGSGKT